MYIYVCSYLFIYIIDERDRLYVFMTLLPVKMVQLKVSKQQLFLITFSVQLNSLLSLLIRLMENFRINHLRMADDIIRITPSAIVRLHQTDERHNHIY